MPFITLLTNNHKRFDILGISVGIFYTMTENVQTILKKMIKIKL